MCPVADRVNETEGLHYEVSSQAALKAAEAMWRMERDHRKEYDTV